MAWANYEFFPHYERKIDGAVVTNTKYYFFGGQRIAQKVGTGALTYLHADHLGSVLATTGVANSKRFYPYGATRTGSIPTDYGYTGQHNDATGLLYYKARYYDPASGQFMSPDTIVPDPDDLFAYNRYMYGYGNPVKYSDPSGHEPHDKNNPCLWTTCLYENGNWIPVGYWDGYLDALYRTSPSLRQLPRGTVDPNPQEAIARQVLAELETAIRDGSFQEHGMEVLEGIASNCGQLMDGACALSVGAGFGTTPANGRVTYDIVADQYGDIATYLTASGGGTFVPSVASVDVVSPSVTLVHGAKTSNFAGFGAEFGISGKSLAGAGVDWVILKGDEGYLHGMSVSQQTGVGVEVHLNMSYSWEVTPWKQK